jgi:hypothetical protein
LNIRIFDFKITLFGKNFKSFWIIHFSFAQTQTAQLRQLSIDFDEGEVCFAPGDVITGVVVIGAVAATATTIQPQPPQQKQSQSPPPPPPQQQQQPLSAGRAVGIGRQQSEDGTGKGGTAAAMAMMSARAWVGEGYDFGLPHHQHRQPPVTQCLLEIVELKMRVHGGARVKGRNRVGEIFRNKICISKIIEIGLILSFRIIYSLHETIRHLLHCFKNLFTSFLYFNPLKYYY